MRGKNSHPATAGECIAALKAAEAVGKGGLVAKDIATHINAAREAAGNKPATNTKAVSSCLQTMETSTTRKTVSVDRERNPYFYSLFNQNGQGESKLSDPNGEKTGTNGNPPPLPKDKVVGDGNGGTQDGGCDKAKQDRPPARERVLMLRNNLTLKDKIWNCQCTPGFPWEKKKSKTELESLTEPQGLAWLDEATKTLEDARREYDARRREMARDDAAAYLEPWMKKFEEQIAAALSRLPDPKTESSDNGSDDAEYGTAPKDNPDEATLSLKQMVIGGALLAIGVLVVVFLV